MITFKRVRMENFLSIGKEAVEVDLGTAGLTLVTGDNGAAKSSACIDSIFYGLYGKSFRKVTLGNLINSTTKKGLLVAVEFSIGETDWKIVRGQKPSVFEIWKNDELVPQMASVRDYQAFLTDSVLKMDERTFRQLVVIGSSSYTPFMTLTAGDRRTVIEDLLRIDVFSGMQHIVKGRVADTKATLSALSSEIQTLEIRLDAMIRSGDNVVSQLQESVADSENELAGVKDRAGELSEKISDAELQWDSDVYDSLKENMETVQGMIDKVKEYAIKKSTRKSIIEKELRFFESNSVCPTCTQSITDEFLSAKRTSIADELEKINSENDKISKKMNELQAQKMDISTKMDNASKALRVIQGMRSELRALENQMASILRRIQELQKRIASASTIDREAMAAIRGQIAEKRDELEASRATATALNELQKLLKDDGVKAVIVRTYLPVLNSLISKYLGIIGFDIGFELNESFEETVTSPGREAFEYSSFSEGERLRIDTALMFSFRELAKIQSSISTNILILDEFDKGTLDEQGFQSIVDILKSCSGENVIVISHSSEYYTSIADRHLIAEKIGGFSRLRVEN